jgi:hypothetical protein
MSPAIQFPNAGHAPPFLVLKNKGCFFVHQGAYTTVDFSSASSGFESHVLIYFYLSLYPMKTERHLQALREAKKKSHVTNNSVPRGIAKGRGEKKERKKYTVMTAGLKNGCGRGRS